MAHDIFISYSSKDSQIAFALCHKLEEELIRCWIAPRDIRPGESFAQEISEAIPKSKIMILVLSSNSNASKQVLREIEIAVHNDLIVIPVRIEDIVPTGGMSYYLSTTHWIDIIDKKAHLNITLLSKRIKNILGAVEGKFTDSSSTSDKKEDITLAPPSSKPKKIGFKKGQLTIIVACAAIVLFTITALTLFAVGVFDIPKENSTIEIDKENDDNIETATVENEQAVPLITDEALLQGIIATLESMGESVNDELTKEDLAKIETLKLLSPDIQKISYYTNDEQYVKTDKYVESLDGIEYLINIKELFLQNNNIVEIDNLENLTKLEILDISYNQVRDIHALSNLNNLEYLYAVGNDYTDISVINKLPRLTRLWIGNKVSDISPVYPLVDLEEFAITSDYIKDISGIKSLVNLKYLIIQRTNVKDISFLSNLNNLEHLYISDTWITDISVLEQLDNLLTVAVDSTIASNNPQTIEILKNRGCQIITP